MAGIALFFAGCHESTPTTTRHVQQEQFREADRGEALLKAAASQLNNLPAAVDTELRPPVIVLDSRNSSDNKDVMATLASNPAMPDSGYNVIRVATGNGRFRSLHVQPGDILKYYVLEDKTVDIDSQKQGLSRQLAMDLTVAQVIDDDTLLLEMGLNQAVDVPAKIEIWRNEDIRLRDIHEKLSIYQVYRKPPLGWEPAPDEAVLTQVMAWLNQWVRQSDPKTDWQLDPVIQTLPAELRNDKELAEYFKPDELAARKFHPYDGRLMQEAVWLRDISRWAHGDSFNDVSRAAALFDWTVRNIQLEPDNETIPDRPWQTLLYGRGTAAQRAWVFALLCRQQGIDVVLLSPSAAITSEGKSAPKMAASEYWIPAVLSDGQLYLFDVRLGLAIPGSGGKGIATLEQARKDDSILRELDVDGAKYPLNSASLKNIDIGLVADPFSLSRRASQVETNLTGDDRLILTARPTKLAGQLKAISGIRAVRLWKFPFQTLHDQLTLGKSARHEQAIAFEPFAMRPGLWKGRVLQFQGKHQEALGDALDVKSKTKPADGYLSPSVRPPDKVIAQATTENERRVDSTAKRDAGYWVGLMSFDDGRYGVAASWLSRPALTASESPWASGANYNLARALEAQGKLDKAIVLLENDTSPQQHGNKLRARKLRSQPKPTKQDNSANQTIAE
ncbi:MAG TPA: transglutaminase family protein [Lacipirellulaceae bacterium]|nr:transglutaminase family protein [Lacipirellulaceae bacterium]